MSNILATDIELGGETVVEYKMITHDSRGLLLSTPELGVSINGSPSFPAKQIINTILSLPQSKLLGLFND